MSKETNHLFLAIEQLRKMLGDVVEKVEEASGYADEIWGEFEQEFSTDLGELQSTLEDLIENLDSSIDEGKTLWEDEESMETSLRAGMDDEENYKKDSEHIQDELEQEEAEKEEDRK